MTTVLKPKEKTQSEGGTANQVAQSNSFIFFFYGAAHASVNLYYPLTEIKRGWYQVITGTLSNAQEIITLAAERTISALFNILSLSFAAV